MLKTKPLLQFTHWDAKRRKSSSWNTCDSLKLYQIHPPEVIIFSSVFLFLLDKSNECESKLNEMYLIVDLFQLLYTKWKLINKKNGYLPTVPKAKKPKTEVPEEWVTG